METEKMNGTPKTHRMVGSLAGTQPRAEIVTVTPELARKWLGQNTANNRNISKATVDCYATEMRAGRWQLTHQGIAFNQTGELVDGQHRLHAVIESGTPIKSYVLTGLPVEYNSAIDQGYNRRVDQILGMPSRVTSAVRALAWMEQGLGNQTKKGLGLVAETRDHHKRATEAVMAVVGQNRMPAHACAVCIYAFPILPDKVLEFVREVATGEMIKRGDPAYKLRAWLERERRSSREVVMGTANAVRAHLLSKPLNAIYANTRLDSDKEGITGYRWICQKRRALKLPWTPPWEVTDPHNSARAKERHAAKKEAGG